MRTHIVRLGVFVLLALALVVIAATPASAISIVGTGTVEGTVRTTGGDPLPGAWVSLYGIQESGSLHATELYASTDASGHFAIQAPNSERYKAVYSPPGPEYAGPTFWSPTGVKPDGAMAATVTVSVGATVSCDATIPVGYRLSGVVTRHANGAGLGGFEVYPWVLDEAAGEWLPMWGMNTISGGTGVGEYSLSLLGGYEYKIQWGSEYTDYPWYMGFWDRGSLLSNATTITAIAGGELDAVDVSLRVKVASETVAGGDRMLTSIAASQKLYPGGGAGDPDAVIIATGYNWPDALAGASLAYAADGPLLLTYRAPSAMPGPVLAEVQRLKANGASRAFILGGEGTVSDAVYDQLVTEFGAGNVHRLAGNNRYETAAMVATNTIERRGPGNYDGTVMIATGTNYADAMAASPVSAKMGWPILLAQTQANGRLTPAMKQLVSDIATDAIILGSDSAVPSAVASDLADALGGWEHVERWAGDTRVDTAIEIAEHAIARPGSPIGWNNLAFSYGWNYPDALSCGPLVADGAASVILLAPNRASLAPGLKAKLASLAASATVADGAVVDKARFLGGSPNPLAVTTRAALIEALE